MLGLALGSLGGVAAATAGHGSAGQARAHHPAGNSSLAVAAKPAGASHIIFNIPWMY
jgi:hypothetical protein